MSPFPLGTNNGVGNHAPFFQDGCTEQHSGRTVDEVALHATIIAYNNTPDMCAPMMMPPYLYTGSDGIEFHHGDIASGGIVLDCAQLCSNNDETAACDNTGQQ